jgi:chromosome segregation ATPase
MISLEQIRVLEQKVQAAVSRIRALSGENSTLKERLGEYEKRVAELETLVSSFKAEQDEIEAGIVAALRQLDDLEHTVGEPEKASGEAHSKAAAATNRTEPKTKSHPGQVPNAIDTPPAEASAASPPV